MRMRMQQVDACELQARVITDVHKAELSCMEKIRLMYRGLPGSSFAPASTSNKFSITDINHMLCT